jgi:hypothetical protein
MTLAFSVSKVKLELIIASVDFPLWIATASPPISLGMTCLQLVTFTIISHLLASYGGLQVRPIRFVFELVDYSFGSKTPPGCSLYLTLGLLGTPAFRLHLEPGFTMDIKVRRRIGLD